jgi:TRAP-type C4-dicarboxylate transport system permease small subunit
VNEEVIMKKSGDYTIAFLLGILTLIMFLQVLFRYVFNNSLTWSEELAKFIFIWITFLGAAICLRDGIHLKVDFLTDRLRGKQKSYLKFFDTLIVTLFNGVISVIGFLWVINVSGTLSPAIGLPLNIVFYAALPVSAVFSFFYGLISLINEYKKIKE